MAKGSIVSRNQQGRTPGLRIWTNPPLRKGAERNITMIDKLFIFWCCTHGWSATDPRAAEEYGMWNAEISAYNETDVDDYGNPYHVTGTDILWDQLRMIEDETSAAEAGC